MDSKYSAFHMALPAILVLNDRYFPKADSDAAKVGATSFALSVVRSLREARLFAGIILYRRQEEIHLPVVEKVTRNSTTCCLISFNFHMQQDTVKETIQLAALDLTASWDRCHSPMLYYQTDTLLHYHPEAFPCCITHHGPFVTHVAEHFSMATAYAAFQGSQKAIHLMQQQENGMHHLLQRKDMFVLQHSKLQRDFLLGCGMDPNRMYPLRPPVDVWAAEMQLESLTIKPTGQQKMWEFVQSSSMLLFTAVARLDFFKHVELLVDAAVELWRRGNEYVRVLVVGGDGTAADEGARLAVAKRVPKRDAGKAMVAQKLSKEDLYLLFKTVTENGVFVCTSRYETLGITPLEAAVSGVSTLIVDSKLVEASRFFPESNRFVPTVNGLADCIAKVQVNKLQADGQRLRQHLQAQMSYEKFAEDLRLAWSFFSCSYLNNPRSGAKLEVSCTISSV